MGIAAQAETVTVGGNDLGAQVSADVAENTSANRLDRDTLDRVPVFDQDYISAVSRFLDDSATGTNGVTLVVNGTEANGPGVTASAIQEVKVNQNPYSALFSRPGRARVEIEVATTFAVSWKPFVKSNASAAATTMMRIRSLCTATSGVLDDDALEDVGDRLGRIDRALEALVDVLPADHDHRVDAALEQRGGGLA